LEYDIQHLGKKKRLGPKIINKPRRFAYFSPVPAAIVGNWMPDKKQNHPQEAVRFKNKLMQGSIYGL